MEKYDILKLQDGKVNVLKDDDIINGVLNTINKYIDNSHNELDSYGKLNSIIPTIINEIGEIEKGYLIFSNDEPVYEVVFVTGDEEIKENFTKDNLDIVLKSDVITMNEHKELEKYRIKEIITDVSFSSPRITIECEKI